MRVHAHPSSPPEFVASISTGVMASRNDVIQFRTVEFITNTDQCSFRITFRNRLLEYNLSGNPEAQAIAIKLR